jgi:formate-dependent phosphoribosylglycinamide formyltransferase (GAR transformylase)
LRLNGAGRITCGADEALRIEGADRRPFGGHESFRRRRMGAALAGGEDIARARCGRAWPARWQRPSMPIECG